ncbi:LPS assembly lipoprotein LptE [Shimia sp. W99]|uniref:LPS-assembly lipoprotein n=1 Tax=Shimia aestuarii TaxID=254406 RepID=A0A1I4MRJ0_9RHOB|nr:LPS assembly lipoprotein LptE [Shimia aestuarii]SFM05941.1 LPS-assembly lipoprotein [Shimia aestuarii]
MSSCNRRIFLLSAAALVGGCGFTPVYGPGGGARGLHQNVLVDEPTDNASYLLVRELEDRLGRGTGGEAYGLTLSLKTRQESVGKTVAQVTSRYNVVGEVTYALRDIGTNEVMTTGKVDTFTSYSTTGSTVSELAAEKDAYQRLMVILADRIVTDLQVYATSNPL